MIRRPIRQRASSGAHLYRRGRKFEYAIRDDLRKRGFVVVRSAGSRSPIDLVALARGHQPVLVQAKRHGRISEAERLELQRMTVQTGALGLLANGAQGGFEYVDVWTGAPWNGFALPVVGEA